MIQADVANLVKEYKKLNEERPDMYVMSFAEHLEQTVKSYKRLKMEEVPIDKRISVMIKWEHGDALNECKIFRAFMAYDMDQLNDSLYEIGQLEEIGNIFSPQMGHEFYGFRVLPELLAANMMDRFELLLPRENGMSGGNVPGTAVINLMMACWYQDEEFAKSARKDTEKQLSKKMLPYDKAKILYLLALLDKNCEEASAQLENLCAELKKSREFGVNKFNKGFAVGAHAMFNFAHHIYDGELTGKIVMPQADNFCQDLAKWQLINQFKPGQVRYRYCEPMELMNKAMDCMPPRMYLKQINSRTRNIDTDRFMDEVVQIIKSM